jgi:hypothetical protein
MDTSTTTESTYRPAGWMAIVSGIIGLLAFGFLAYGLIPHWHLAPGDELLRFRAHDAGVIFQFLFMIPIVFKLHEFFCVHRQEKNQGILSLGIGSLLLTVILLVFNFLKVSIIADVLYMVPQGAFGVWLMIVNKRMAELLSKRLRQLGIVAGLGLFIVGTFPILFAVLVDTLILQGQAPEGYEPPATIANLVIHLILIFGTVMGVTTFPIWSILIGRKFLGEPVYKERLPLN